MKAWSKKKRENERGVALVMAVMILLILTVIGIYAVTTSTMETKITGFHKLHVTAFYAADAGASYVAGSNPHINMEPVGDVAPDPWTNNTTTPKNAMTVTYRGKARPPVGSGQGLRITTKLYHYKTTSVGHDPADVATSTVSLWIYRLGF
jgi:hypothetical protein